LVALVPLVVTLIAVVALRRAAVTPLGVVRMINNKRPNVVPGILIGLGVGAFAVIEPLTRYFARENTPGQAVAYVLIGLMFIGMLLVSIGIVTGTAWLTYASGRVLHRFARRPAALLAGRRMIADPWSGSRDVRRDAGRAGDRRIRGRDLRLDGRRRRASARPGSSPTCSTSPISVAPTPSSTSGRTSWSATPCWSP
jgi:hypothetical protein